MYTNHFLKNSPVDIDLVEGKLSGELVLTQKKTIGELQNIFIDENFRSQMPQDKVAYEVQLFMPIKEGTEGGMFFGNTTIFPITIGQECMMTKGHYHAIRNRNEYYLGIRGNGYLLFMNNKRETWVEKMKKGSLHFIGPDLAHRVINIGDEPLTLLASWHADAGHEYDTILQTGFPLKVFNKNGKIVIENYE
jgi:glucose-6-phosphate isomerase